MSEPLPRALAVVGPTAAGKGALGRAIARRLGRAVFVCDSVKVYRGLDIGSGKPDVATQGGVPHELVDLVDPDANFSAGDWAERAWALHAERAGVIVGGTGFYLRQFAWRGSEADDPAAPDRPRDDPERVAFDDAWRAREHGEPGAIWRALEAVDPASADAIHPANVVRALRALWLCTRAGAPLSATRAADPPRPRVELMLLVLDPGPELLAGRIERRVDAMLAAGFVDEVERLVASGYHGGHKAMQSLGYKQLLELVHGRTDLRAARTNVIVATRQLAKRQRTYFRHQFPGVQVHRIASEAECPWPAIERFVADDGVDHDQ